jgi:hypothetical protein
MDRDRMTGEKLRFPGLKNCVAMMRSPDGQTREEGFHWILSRANQFIDELLQEFQTETDHGVRCWLLELIGEAKSERAEALLIEQAKGRDERFRDWAVRGLQKLDTKSARTALWNIFGDQVPQV